MPTNSLDSVNQQLESAFNHNPHLFQNKLHFSRNNGRVVLHGNVKSYFEKQMAQEALRNIDGINEIENELTVDWS